MNEPITEIKLNKNGDILPIWGNVEKVDMFISMRAVGEAVVSEEELNAEDNPEVLDEEEE